MRPRRDQLHCSHRCGQLQCSHRWWACGLDATSFNAAIDVARKPCGACGLDVIRICAAIQMSSKPCGTCGLSASLQPSM
eukprot:2630360-Karenia_brevis.AAC.1